MTNNVKAAINIVKAWETLIPMPRQIEIYRNISLFTKHSSVPQQLTLCAALENLGQDIVVGTKPLTEIAESFAKNCIRAHLFNFHSNEEKYQCYGTHEELLSHTKTNIENIQQHIAKEKLDALLNKEITSLVKVEEENKFFEKIVYVEKTVEVAEKPSGNHAFLSFFAMMLTGVLIPFNVFAIVPAVLSAISCTILMSKLPSSRGP